jgi:protein TonB
MNTKFILPAALVLTLHAFLLFGLSGKTPINPPLPEPPAPKLPTPPIDPDETIRVTGTEEDPGPERGDSVAPRPVDLPIPVPTGDPFIVPILPPIPGSRTITTIPPGWERPRDPGDGVTLKPIPGADLDRVPRARLQPAPDYPFAMRSRRIEGTVVVEFLVDELGKVYSTAVLRATNPGFEEAALRAVARWKFESGYKDGRRVRFRMSVPVVFRIDAS